MLLHHSSLGSQGKDSHRQEELEAGADAETMESAGYWLAPMACSACLLIESKTTTNHRLDPLPSINNPEF